MGRKLYYTRHGESLWNVENKICGQTDIPLTEHGHHQAEETGRMILERKIPIDEIVDTLKITGQLMSPLLKETSQGGLAKTKTGLELEKKLFKNNSH